MTAYLKIILTEDSYFGLSRIAAYDFTKFSVKNQYTSEAGTTIIYPVRMQKTRIAITAEIYRNEFENLMLALQEPEMDCEFYAPSGEKSGIFTVSSDISVSKIMPDLYAVSFTLEEI